MNISMIRLGQAHGIVLGTLACLLAGTVLPRDGMAQGTVATYANTDAYGNPVISGCGTKQQLAQSFTSFTCGPVPIQGGMFVAGNGFASAIAGQLRASTSGSVALTDIGSATTRAFSQWSDQALVTPLPSAPAATHLQIALQVTGALSANGDGICDPNGAFTGGMGALADFGAQSTNAGDTPVGGTWVASGPRCSPTLGASVNQIFVLSLGLSNGSTAPFSYSISASGDASSYGQLGSPTTASWTADFAHTVNPLWYRVLDANNGDVTSAYNVTFTQGMAFGPAATTTPEPSSLAMLGTGIVGLFGFRRARRNHA